MFLRADGFCVKDVAARMMRHFDMKMELFSVDNLCQDITLKDLDPFDL
jgi:hypothetical protein